MRIAEYKQIDSKVVERIRYIENEDGTATGEVYTERVPIMGMVYRDATDEEIAEMESVEPIEIEPTPEERIEALESALLELIIGGGM